MLQTKGAAIICAGRILRRCEVATDDERGSERDGYRSRSKGHSDRAVLPNGSRLSCGRRARGRKAVEAQITRLAGEAAQFFPTWSARQLQALVRWRAH